MTHFKVFIATCLLAGSTIIGSHTWAEDDAGSKTSFLKTEWSLDEKKEKVILKVTNVGDKTVKISGNIECVVADPEEIIPKMPLFQQKDAINCLVIFLLKKGGDNVFTGSSRGGRVLPPIMILPGKQRSLNFDLNQNFILAAKNAASITLLLSSNGSVIYSQAQKQ